MKPIEIKNTSIIVHDYELGSQPQLEKLLSVWNQTCYRYDPKGYIYKEDTRELRLPRGINMWYLEKTFNIPCQIDYKYDPFENVIYKLKLEPRDDIQKRGISFLLGENEFFHTKKYSQLSLNFDTGYGKTYTAIAALTYMQMKSIIIVNRLKLKNQWRDEFIDKTNLSASHICIVSSSHDIQKLMKENNSYKVYIVNHQTLFSYAKSHSWEEVGLFFKHIKVGVKIYDEAHMEFENIIRIDLHTNTKKTFYLTANFQRSSYDENKLFATCFRNVVQYGLEEKVNVRKHIKYLAVFFNSKPNYIDRMTVKNKFGLNKNAYIAYQLKKDDMLSIVEMLINKIVKGKLLVLFSTIDATDIVYNYLKVTFPDKTVSIINSNIPDEIKDQSYAADIIVSTPKSLGTGVDIKELKYIINTEPFSSEILTNQIPGRLRALSENEYSLYIEIIDKGFKEVVNAYKKRLKILKNKCFETKIYEFK
jgi:superfamily II DNA or RNA helicase